VRLTGDDAVALAERVGSSAESHGTVVRALGGVGIYLRSSAARPELGREYGDVDLVAPGNARKRVMALMTDAGLVPEERFNARQGHRRQIWWTPDGESHIDVFLGRFEMCHRLDLDTRLDIEHPALPAADLLLTKLQIVELTEKDVTDTAMLLQTHTLSDRDGEGELNVDRLVEVLADDWCFYTTFTDNLQELPAVVDRTVGSPSADVERASTQLLDALSTAPKTRSFKLRARIGRRKRWYELPEETLDPTYEPGGE
jgi:hypothetical protein